MKTLLSFISPFALEQKIVLIDDEDKDFFKEFSSEINSMENIGLDLLEQYDNINKIIFKGPKEYTSRFLSSLQNKVNTKFKMNDIKFELREQGEHI